MGRKLLLVSASLAISLPGQRLIVHHSSHHPPFIFHDLPPSIISLMLLMMILIFHVSEPFNSHSHSLLTAYHIYLILQYPSFFILYWCFFKMKSQQTVANPSKSFLFPKIIAAFDYRLHSLTPNNNLPRSMSQICRSDSNLCWIHVWKHFFAFAGLVSGDQATLGYPQSAPATSHTAHFPQQEVQVQRSFSYMLKHEEHPK